MLDHTGTPVARTISHIFLVSNSVKQGWPITLHSYEYHWISAIMPAVKTSQNTTRATSAILTFFYYFT